MSFLSLAFVGFTGAVLLGFHLTEAKLRRHVLLFASCAFYASHSPGYLLLLLLATAIVHRVALAVEQGSDERQKLHRVVAGTSCLVLLLAGFKLVGALQPWPFFAETTSQGTMAFLLPLGLSYYVFRLIAYLLEVYWENIRAESSWLSVAIYSSFFPQVVSGPIQRPGPFFAQLRKIDRVEPDSVVAGLRRILFGFFKKVAIADRLAIIVSTAHANPQDLSSLELLFASYVFAIQLYADFSGLTDIALGLGQLLGFKGPENFDRPFFARNLQEYWRRWHMSLTSWLADYLFTPLRMALRDRGRPGLSLAVFLNMVAVGVWHGFTGAYLAFGIFHGVCLTLSVLTLKKRNAFFKARPVLAPIRAVVAPLITFHLVVLGLVIFRAESLTQASTYLTHMVGLSGHPDIAASRLDLKLLHATTRATLSIGVLAGLMEVIHHAACSPRWTKQFLSMPRPLRWSLYYGCLIVTLAFSRFGEDTFIYGQF